HQSFYWRHLPKNRCVNVVIKLISKSDPTPHPYCSICSKWNIFMYAGPIERQEQFSRRSPMPIEIETTILTVIVAFIVGILTVAVSYIIGSRQLKQNEEKTHRELELELNRFREEQKQWITDLQAAYELEKYKTRIASYPAMFVIIGKLSHKAK